MEKVMNFLKSNQTVKSKVLLCFLCAWASNKIYCIWVKNLILQPYLRTFRAFPVGQNLHFENRQQITASTTRKWSLSYRTSTITNIVCSGSAIRFYSCSQAWENWNICWCAFSNAGWKPNDTFKPRAWRYFFSTTSLVSDWKEFRVLLRRVPFDKQFKNALWTAGLL